jgi:DNA-binding transcriptional ArsR family regulator
MQLLGRRYLLEALKTLADASRLTLLQLLNEREYSVGELAERIKLSEPTVSHHLARLRASGLVTLRMSGTQHYYSLNVPGLARFKQIITHIEAMPAEPEPAISDNSWIDTLSWSEEDKQVLRDYTENGRITRLPSKQKKTLVILHWLVTMFKPDTLYTELEVNAVLKGVYEADYVSLRRDLVDFGYLRRERGGGKYWLAPATQDTPAT